MTILQILNLMIIFAIGNNDILLMHTKNRYIDALIDSGFKAIFGKPGYSEEILKGFLNTLYAGEPNFDPIKSVTFTNPIQDPVPVRGKTIIHDVICETDNGHKFILEM